MELKQISWENLFPKQYSIEEAIAEDPLVVNDILIKNDSDYSQLKNFPKLNRLSFVDVGFTHIPEVIFNIESLESLNIVNNLKLSDLTLPNVAFSKLSHLNINNCRLTEIPKGIYRLSNLKYLNVEGNEISHLGDEILDLHLEYLNVGRNKLTIISEELSKLLS